MRFKIISHIIYLSLILIPKAYLYDKKRKRKKEKNIYFIYFLYPGEILPPPIHLQSLSLANRSVETLKHNLTRPHRFRGLGSGHGGGATVPSPRVVQDEALQGRVVHLMELRKCSEGGGQSPRKTLHFEGILTKLPPTRKDEIPSFVLYEFKSLKRHSGIRSILLRDALASGPLKR